MRIPDSRRARRVRVVPAAGEPIGITENDVVHAVVRHLGDDGWTIIGFCVDAQRGYDVEARKGGRRLVVEAKGTRTAGKPLISQQQRNAYAAHAIAKAVMLHSEDPDREVAIALPDDRVFRQEIAKAQVTVQCLGITVMWIREDGVVAAGT